MLPGHQPYGFEPGYSPCELQSLSLWLSQLLKRLPSAGANAIINLDQATVHKQAAKRYGRLPSLAAIPLHVMSFWRAILHKSTICIHPQYLQPLSTRLPW